MPQIEAVSQNVLCAGSLTFPCVKRESFKVVLANEMLILEGVRHDQNNSREWLLVFFIVRRMDFV